ncbi:hypothetical protein BGZ73_007044 [Actinomortierella ambigua]|nr:hypothetical protein BGZ73_007044 [Actinomortierella ambigua]
MKFITSLVVLAAAASSVLAVVPIPIKECKKLVMVTPADSDGCVLFAGRYGITYPMLVEWNAKLDAKHCKNLDVGHEVCVANATHPKRKGDRPEDFPYTPKSSIILPTPTGTPGSNPAPPVITSGAASPTAPGPAGATRPASMNNTGTNTPDGDKAGSSAAVNKGSLMVAAAGVVLSVAYML